MYEGKADNEDDYRRCQSDDRSISVVYLHALFIRLPLYVICCLFLLLVCRGGSGHVLLRKRLILESGGILRGYRFFVEGRNPKPDKDCYKNSYKYCIDRF